MKIEQKFSLNAPPDRVWALLIDPYQVASCLPGAAIAGKVDDRTYLGTATIKVGPVTASYRGKIRFERLDPEQWEAELVGQGQDIKGKGGVEIRMQSHLHPKNGATEVTLASEVKISGILAQMGRGMIESVSNQILQQFASAMQQKLEAASPFGQAGAPAAEPEAKPLDALSLGAKALGQAMRGAVRRFVGGGFAKPGVKARRRGTERFRDLGEAVIALLRKSGVMVRKATLTCLRRERKPTGGKG